eukprot:GFYU01007881.1.p1 GENE.GFYU01007881.1~~GFYU01007881.1.p1  ORF type:complete len:318 (+),score=47.63 GFYU01007881.1:90-1043(+)
MKSARVILVALLASVCMYPAMASSSQPHVTIHPDEDDLNRSTLKFTSYFQTFENGFYFEAIADYLSRTLPYHVQLVPSNSTYSGPVNEADNPFNPVTKSDPVVLGKMCGGNYALMNSKYLELSVAPTVSSRPEYYSYVVVPRDSPANSLDDLRGANVTFGVNEPHSLSGVWMLRQELRTKYNVTGDDAFERFFGAPTYRTGGHFGSMQELMKSRKEGRHIDAATIDSNFFFRGTVIYPGLADRVRVVGRLGPYPMPPLVVAAWASSELKDAIRKALVHAHEDAAMRDALAQCNFDGFARVDDVAYNAIREVLDLPLH